MEKDYLYFSELVYLYDVFLEFVERYLLEV